jgi:threonine/homoserine/homoserine lactone efflux protein
MQGETLVTGLLALAPLSFSPGPANTLFAASGAAFGVRATLPFLLGSNLACTAQTLAVGLGLSAAFAASATVQALFHWAGILLLVFLAIRFLRQQPTRKTPLRPPTFHQGLLLELLNTKFLLIPVVMFSLFSPTGHTVPWQHLIGLTAALIALTASANLTWTIGGKTAAALVTDQRLVQKQGLLFGILLLLTAGWLAFF